MVLLPSTAVVLVTLSFQFADPDTINITLIGAEFVPADERYLSRYLVEWTVFVLNLYTFTSALTSSVVL